MDLKVQKRRISAQVAIRGQRILRGSFFVVPPSYVVPDSDLLVRLLNESDDYVPFERMKRIVLLNKYHISYAKLVRDGSNAAGTGFLVRKVRVVLPTQQELSGTVSIDLPVERQRVLDFLNLKAPFFVLATKKEYYVLNKSIVQGIFPEE